MIRCICTLKCGASGKFFKNLQKSFDSKLILGRLVTFFFAIRGMFCNTTFIILVHHYIYHLFSTIGPTGETVEHQYDGCTGISMGIVCLPQQNFVDIDLIAI